MRFRKCYGLDNCNTEKLFVHEWYKKCNARRLSNGAMSIVGPGRCAAAGALEGGNAASALSCPERRRAALGRRRPRAAQGRRPQKTPKTSTQRGTWCSGITPAQHAGGPGFNLQCVHHVLKKNEFSREAFPKNKPSRPFFEFPSFTGEI